MALGDQLLGMLAGHAGVGLCVLDPGLRFVWVNPALAAMNGLPPGEHVGRLLEDAVPGISPEVLAAYRRVAGTGQPELGIPLRGPRLDDGTRAHLRVDVHPLVRDGILVGVGGLAVDVTELGAARREAERAAGLLDFVIQNAPIGFSLFDRDLRYLRVNLRMAQINGVPMARHVGHTPMELVPGLPEPAVRSGFERALAGESPARVDVSTGRPGDPGTRHRQELWYPVAGRGGAAVVGAFVLDVTEQVRAQERLALLGEVSAVLEQELGLAARLDALTGVLVPRLADSCVVDLVTEDGVVAAAVANRDEAAARVTRALGPPTPGSPRQRALHERRPVLLREVQDVHLRESAVGEAQLALRRSLAPRSAIVVPLVRGGRVLGALSISTMRDQSDRAYDDDDLALAVQVAHRAAVSIDNARLYEDQRRVAEALQAGLLPARLPGVPGLDLGARYVAGGPVGEVGGDFYDVMPLGGGGWAAVVGDVCGRGPEAATLTGLARHTLRALARRDAGPAALLDALDGAVRGGGGGAYLTAALAALEPAAGGGWAVTLALAGHPPPLVAGPGGGRTAGRAGRLLGVGPMGGRPIVEERFIMAPGDALVMYTDGVTEARPAGAGPEAMLGLDGLRRVLGPRGAEGAQAVADALVEEVLRHAGRPRDDAVVLVVRADPARAAPAPPSVRLTVPAEPTSVEHVRREVGRVARRAGLGDARAQDVVLAVSEACTNAVVHAYAGRPGEVQVDARAAGGGLVVEVRDSGRGITPGADRSSAGLGLGLGLMARLADEVSLASGPGGTRVTLRFAGPA